jgi:quercetin dioxygenase-like cupin family protein
MRHDDSLVTMPQADPSQEPPTPANVPSPSPRPSFSEPTHIRSDQVTLHLWGDEDSGQVPDWIYVSSEKIHHLVFGLPPGGAFRHSQSFRTVFAADELLYVLAGTMALANPETGEVLLARTGEAVFFRRDTWHHAFSFDDEALRVLEFFAPPPASGASSAYAKTRDYLERPSYVDDRWLGRWPQAKAERDREATMRAMRDDDVLWSLEGRATLVGTYVSTEHLTAARIVQRPGGSTDVRSHGGDATMHIVRGTANVLLHDVEGQRWFEVRAGDGFFLPEGTRYELRNVTGSDTEVMFAAAPSLDPR